MLMMIDCLSVCHYFFFRSGAVRNSSKKKKTQIARNPVEISTYRGASERLCGTLLCGHECQDPLLHEALTMKTVGLSHYNDHCNNK